jgi:hypothetical protein
MRVGIANSLRLLAAIKMLIIAKSSQLFAGIK